MWLPKPWPLCNTLVIRQKQIKKNTSTDKDADKETKVVKMKILYTGWYTPQVHQVWWDDHLETDLQALHPPPKWPQWAPVSSQPQQEQCHLACLPLSPSLCIKTLWIRLHKGYDSVKPHLLQPALTCTFLLLSQDKLYHISIANRKQQRRKT